MRFKNETHAWVMWSMNYIDPRIWMGELWGGTFLYDHFMSKFNGIYQRCGCRAVMNTFFCELSDGHAERLRDWVMDNYAHENWSAIAEELYLKYKGV